MATFEICREPLLLDLRDIYARAAYLEAFYVWKDVYAYGGSATEASQQICEIAEENELSEDEIAYIGRRAMTDAIELSVKDCYFPVSWLQGAA